MSVFDKKKGINGKTIGRPHKDGIAKKVSVSISLSLSTAERLISKPKGERSEFVEKALLKAFVLEDFNNER